MSTVAESVEDRKEIAEGRGRGRGRGGGRGRGWGMRQRWRRGGSRGRDRGGDVAEAGDATEVGTWWRQGTRHLILNIY